ncbi:MAG: DUF4139 domain-containing protein [Bacteroidales bacterium]|jgi:uncharacterized protein (TIGR02231 family)|nr:DUF4139 domain-containing protein [Bacteroidales bacterium]MDD4215364.1 DUF4139 domain-containing protein [Bacteroidales bacterium]
MKKLIVLILFSIFLSADLYAQKENVIKATPEINDVIIYLNGAQLRYKIPVNLVAGRNLVEIKGLAPGIDVSSIRITSDEKSAVLSVVHRKTFENVESEMLKFSIVSDSVKLLLKKINLIGDEKNALSVQKDVLMKNISLGGDNNGVNFLDLQKAADYYQQKIFEINKRISDLSADEESLKSLLTALQIKAGKLKVLSQNQLSEVLVLIMAENVQSTTLEFSYVVKEAGWMPYYDLKCDDISKPIKLNYRAKAYNNCGIKWDHVSVILSTADPMQSINVPEMKTWYLNTYSNIYNKDKSGYYSVNNENQYVFEQTKGDDQNIQQQKVRNKRIEVPEMSFYFPIKNRYTFSSDAQPYIVDVDEYSLAATYRYVCVPAAEKSAFLLACIGDWEELNLVEGNANIYLNGTFVGQSYLNPNEISDTLQVSLGRDSRIQVDRVKLKEYSSKVLIGTKRKATYVYEISVKNNRTAPITVEIQDQLPVSNNQEIEVTVDQISAAQHDLATGFLKWNFNIDPGKLQTVKMGYTVKYPKTVTLQFKKMKAVECPAFL